MLVEFPLVLVWVVLTAAGLALAVIALLYLQIRRMAAARLEAIAEVRRAADALTTRVEQTSAAVTRDTAHAIDEQTAEILGKARQEAQALVVMTELKAVTLQRELLEAADRVRIETAAVAEALRRDQSVIHQELSTQIADVSRQAEQTAAGKKLETLQHTADQIEGKVDSIQGRPTTEKLVALQVTADGIDSKVDDLANPKVASLHPKIETLQTSVDEIDGKVDTLRYRQPRERRGDWPADPKA